MAVLYAHARRLIEQGDAYACACPADLLKKLRFEGVACEHRDQPVEKNLEIWEGMLSRRFKEGEYVIRLKGGPLEPRPLPQETPNLMRMIDSPHPLVGTEYVVWPRSTTLRSSSRTSSAASPTSFEAPSSTSRSRRGCGPSLASRRSSSSSSRGSTSRALRCRSGFCAPSSRRRSSTAGTTPACQR